MPEFEITDEHLARAEKLSERLHKTFKGRETRFGVLREATGSVEGNVPLRDVHSLVRTFAALYSFAQDRGGPIAAGRLGENQWIPILSAAQSGWISTSTGNKQDYEYYLHAAANFWPEEDVQLVGPEEAEAGFFRGLRDFLVHRLAGFDFWRKSFRGETGAVDIGLPDIDEAGPSGVYSSGPPPAPPGGGPFPSAPSNIPPPTAQPGVAAANGGLRVTLWCTNSNLRALASTAMAVQWHQFGWPTKPVHGTLLPGVWIFAADGGIFGSSIVVDKVPAKIPPLLSPCATAF